MIFIVDLPKLEILYVDDYSCQGDNDSSRIININNGKNSYKNTLTMKSMYIPFQSIDY